MAGKAHRLRVLAAGLAATLIVAACGNGGTGTGGGPPAPPQAGHENHAPGAIPAAAPLRPGERFVTLTMPQP